MFETTEQLHDSEAKVRGLARRLITELQLEQLSTAEAIRVVEVAGSILAARHGADLEAVLFDEIRRVLAPFRREGRAA